MGESKACECSTAPKLIFACSGAADVGALSDQAARKMTRDGNGKMFCLAGIGARISGIMKNTEAAAAILAIDGCALNCASKSLEEAGFKNFEHLLVSDLGFQKGESPVTEDAVAKIAEAGAKLISKGVY
ncbi:putative zinc-binding protein [Desulforegula conservatrix]|uniref:putative zinc-binding protein n=1 Tax=Desulforegula conservatrix TaxID=153026 RepID=UPI0004229B8F|nr:putative zinc-binding protein [Desulforegula conservatrix]